MTEQKPVSDTAATKVTLPDAQTVNSVTHWTDRLFSFRVTRPQSLRFRSGEFVMIGLLGENGKPLLRAYSIASPAWDEELEFYSIKVPDGPLTSKLQHIQPGDQIILRPKPVGTLVHDALLPGKRVWFLATGTGIALLVTFAEQLRRQGETPLQTAVEEARARMRPVLMTSAAMIAGMIPMALAFGEGAEATAPLGRAVIGGLAAATLATLVVLPSVYSLIQRSADPTSPSLDPDDPESAFRTELG